LRLKKAKVFLKAKQRKANLLYYFSLLPAQVFAFAFSAFHGGFSIACTAVSADFHVQSVLLRDGFFHRI
jgi:hypothetical protein